MIKNLFRKPPTKPTVYKGSIEFVYGDKATHEWGRSLRSEVESHTVGGVLDELHKLSLTFWGTFAEKPDFFVYTYPEYDGYYQYKPDFDSVSYVSVGGRWLLREKEDGTVESRIGWVIEHLIEDLGRKAERLDLPLHPMLTASDWENETKRIAPKLKEWAKNR